MSQHEPHTTENLTESSAPPVSRRGFAKYLGIGAVVAAAAAVIAFFRGRDQAYPVTTIGQIDEIPVGGSKVFAYPQNDRPCFLLRPAEDRYIAFSRLCTHHGCPTFFQPQESFFGAGWPGAGGTAAEAFAAIDSGNARECNRGSWICKVSVKYTRFASKRLRCTGKS
jgi:Rieske Fe-S protein